MKLTLEHLCAYLPHDVCVHHSDLAEYGGKKKQSILTTFMLMHWRDMFDDMRPILRHPSCLTKEIEHRGDRVTPIDKIQDLYEPDLFDWDTLKMWVGEAWTSELSDWPYSLVQILLKWHIDVFGLIEAGLAIDVETLDVNPYAK